MEVGSSDEETPLESAPFKEEHVHAILRALKACKEILEHKKSKFPFFLGGVYVNLQNFNSVFLF